MGTITYEKLGYNIVLTMPITIIPNANFRCTTSSILTNDLVMKHTFPSNEGYSSLLCGALLAHILEEVNTNGPSKCKFEINPVVKQEIDAGNNKHSDYSIFRIRNKITYVMIEVKLEVPNLISAGETKDNIAQLLLEARYCSEEEERREDWSMFCILTNGFAWHGIIVELRKSMNILCYHRVTISDDSGYEGLGKICEMITNYIITK